jgi:UDP-GlcNAc:undecaprenyl-phosphate GlcNAc-1-phosphate transferase
MLVSSLVTFFAIYLLRPIAIHINLVDSPSSRKIHFGTVPLIGGVSMYIGVVTGILLTATDLNQFNYFLLTSTIIILMGIFDDHQDISVGSRLFLQTLVAVIIVTLAGINLESIGYIFGDEEFLLGEWAVFATILVIIASMNAVNMSDGIHGLAGGTSLISFLAIYFLSHESQSDVILIICLFCSVLPVFLINNLCIGLSQKSRIFMGDGGSMFIGLGIVWVLLDLSQGETKSFSPVIALWLFAVPIVELVTAVLRRISSGSSPFKPDIYHFHHLLIHWGINEKNSLKLILSVSFFMSFFGILGEIYGVADWIMFIGFIFALLCYGAVNRIAFNSINLNAK